MREITPHQHIGTRFHPKGLASRFAKPQPCRRIDTLPSPHMSKRLRWGSPRTYSLVWPLRHTQPHLCNQVFPWCVSASACRVSKKINKNAIRHKCGTRNFQDPVGLRNTKDEASCCFRATKNCRQRNNPLTTGSERNFVCFRETSAGAETASSKAPGSTQSSSIYDFKYLRSDFSLASLRIARVRI